MSSCELYWKIPYIFQDYFGVRIWQKSTHLRDEPLFSFCLFVCQSDFRRRGVEQFSGAWNVFLPLVCTWLLVSNSLCKNFLKRNTGHGSVESTYSISSPWFTLHMFSCFCWAGTVFGDCPTHSPTPVKNNGTSNSDVSLFICYKILRSVAQSLASQKKYYFPVMNCMYSNR